MLHCVSCTGWPGSHMHVSSWNCMCMQYVSGTLWSLKMEHHNIVCQLHVIVGHSQRELNLWISSCNALHLQINCQTCISAITCCVLLDTFPVTHWCICRPSQLAVTLTNWLSAVTFWWLCVILLIFTHFHYFNLNRFTKWYIVLHDLRHFCSMTLQSNVT